eukprot:747591-Hanusia_phi.AAC.4
MVFETVHRQSWTLRSDSLESEQAVSVRARSVRPRCCELGRCSSTDCTSTVQVSSSLTPSPPEEEEFSDEQTVWEWDGSPIKKRGGIKYYNRVAFSPLPSS